MYSQYYRSTSLVESAQEREWSEGEDAAVKGLP